MLVQFNAVGWVERSEPSNSRHAVALGFGRVRNETKKKPRARDVGFQPRKAASTQPTPPILGTLWVGLIPALSRGKPTNSRHVVIVDYCKINHIRKNRYCSPILRTMVNEGFSSVRAGRCKMRHVLASVALISGVSLSVPSLAATVQAIEGTVSINHGQGYQRVSLPTQVKAGDSIMADPGGGAELAYDDRCRVKVRPGAVVSVKREPPCWASARMNLGRGSLKDTLPPPPALVEEPAEFSLGPVIAAGVIVGGIIASVTHKREEIEIQVSP